MPDPSRYCISNSMGCGGRTYDHHLGVGDPTQCRPLRSLSSKILAPLRAYAHHNHHTANDQPWHHEFNCLNMLFKAAWNAFSFGIPTASFPNHHARLLRPVHQQPSFLHPQTILLPSKVIIPRAPKFPCDRKQQLDQGYTPIVKELNPHWKRWVPSRTPQHGVVGGWRPRSLWVQGTEGRIGVTFKDPKYIGRIDTK